MKNNPTSLIAYLNQFEKITIWGFGKENQSFYNFIKKHTNINPTIIDKNPKIFENITINDEINLNQKLQNSDLIIKSPGISLYNYKIDPKLYNFSSTTNIFLKFYKNKTIGITGTKGKSTTATIIHQLLKNNNKESILVGNIGIPIFDIIDKITDQSIIVFELSSHQLELLSHSPHIAVLLNLYEDHLDYYQDKSSYFKAKLNIFKYQNKNDIAIYDSNINNKVSFQTNKIHDINNQKTSISNKLIHPNTIKILNTIANLYNLTNIKKTIAEFTTLPHRLEFVATKNGISFYNDSISTIPESTIAGIKALQNIKILIVGGYDRGVNYDKLITFLENNPVEYLMLLDQTGQKIYNKLDKTKCKNIIYEKNLEDIFKHIKNLNTKGICLFSPAASSFSQFKNYEQRGNVFKVLVQEE